MGMMQEVFGKPKAIIAMVHFPPLPGQPLYDDRGGMGAIYDRVSHDLSILIECGVDAVMFCNEGDRPYRTRVGPEVPAVVGTVIGRLMRDLTIPFGVDVLWDPMAAVALAHATGARFVREVFTGVYAADFGMWNTEPADVLRYRRLIGGSDIKLLCNITAEFASPLAGRDIGTTARSVVFSSLMDALCVSGPITGTGVEVDRLAAVKTAVPDVPVLANTGVRAATVGEILAVADGCVVGTALKRDGVTWNEVDRHRVSELLIAAEASGHWTWGPTSPSGRPRPR
jgi:uncharacterized protein